MNTTIFLVVLFGALLHAFWNTQIKLAPDKPLETSLMNLTGSILVLPALIIFGIPDQSVWPYIAVSLALHIIYYYSLANAYQWGEMSLTYPIMRGVAPLILLVLSILLNEDSFTLYQTTAIFFIGFGLIFLSTVSQKNQNLIKAISFSLLNALVIALYTIVDGLGVRASQNPFSYIAMLLFLDGFLYSIIIFNQRLRSIEAIGQYSIKRWPFFLSSAIATISSYGIALWAMTVAPIGVVAALREISVLFVFLIAIFFLKEQFGKYKWIGVLLIFAGVILIKLES